PADILLGDTMGELMSFYGACDLAFVGGSLVPTGGHNMIEAAAWGVPVVTGPHLFNFAEASRLLIEGDAMIVCEDADSLAEQCIGLFANRQRCTQMGDAAHRIAEANRGALDRLLAVIDHRL
ncbi:MAG: 3-deoxy-D-manno-octulosonic acid transferase, partial [Porticoccaceae bacterium]